MTSIAIDRLDGLSSSTAMKGPCRVASQSNIALEGEQTIDGVSVVTDDRVLVMGQTAPAENGIYVVDTGPWQRAKDFSRNRDVRRGTQVVVNDGTVPGWYGVSTPDPIIVGTTGINFAASSALGLDKLPLAGGTMTGPIGFTHQDTPGNPGAGVLKVYSKNDDRLYTLNSAGEETRIGAGDIAEVATRTALKALDTTKTTTAILRELGREGIFLWRAGDHSAEVAADTGEGIYVDAGDGSTGAWIRADGGWAVQGAEATWFGYVADYDEGTQTGTDNAAIINAALAVPGLPGLRVPSGAALIPSTVEIPIGKFVRGVPAAFPSFLGGVPRPSSIESGTVWVSNTAGAMTSSRPTNEVVRQNRDTELRDILLFWDDQPTPASSWTPSDTPWAVRCGRFTDTARSVRAEHTRTVGVIALGFTHGFEFQRGGEGGLIRDCKVHAFKVGYSLDGVHHIIQLDNIECFPYWSVQADVTLYTLDHLVAFEIGRVDGLKAKGGLFSIYANVGVQFIPSRSPDFTGHPAFLFDIDAIYSDGCTHGLMVGPSLTAQLTGHIGHLISNRTSTAGLAVSAGNDYGVRLRASCDISIDKFEGTGAGFTRMGGHVAATTAGAKLHIEYARLSQWDSDALSKPAFSFGVAGTYLYVGHCDLHDGSAYFSSSKRIYSGVSASGEDNIVTGQHLYIDAVGLAANKAVTINSSDQTLMASYPVKLIAAGFREFRMRGRVAAHATATSFTLKSAGMAGWIENVQTLAIAAGNTDVDGAWTAINRTVATEAEFGALLAVGTPGDASLTFTRLGFEFR